MGISSIIYLPCALHGMEPFGQNLAMSVVFRAPCILFIFFCQQDIPHIMALYNPWQDPGMDMEKGSIAASYSNCMAQSKVQIWSLLWWMDILWRRIWNGLDGVEAMHKVKFLHVNPCDIYLCCAGFPEDDPLRRFGCQKLIRGVNF